MAGRRPAARHSTLLLPPPAFAALLLLLLVIAAPLAAAHAEVESSEPAQGARLATAPAQVVVRLSEPVEASATSMTVVDANGSRVDLDDLSIGGSRSKPELTLSLHGDLGPGAYAIVWSTVSRTDGHPTGGRVGFAVGDFEPPAGTADTGWPKGLAVAGRSLAYAGLALAFGAAAWTWYVRADVDGLGATARKALFLGGAVHTLGLLFLMKATADSAGLGPAALAASKVGRLLTFRLVTGLGALVLGGLAVLPRNPARLGLPLAAALLLAAGLGSAAIGHAAGEGLPGMAVDAMHLVASLTWVGGLAMLFVALGKASRLGLPAEAVRRIGLRFGTLALTCVIVLFLAGAAASLLILGRDAVLHPFGLLDGLYGRFLVAKVALASLMVALAAANRYVFLEPPASGAASAGNRLAASVSRLGPDGTPSGLRRTVAVEASVGITVLLLAGFLTAVSPAVDAHDHGGAGIAAFAEGSQFHFHLEADPAPQVGGRSDLRLSILDLATGEPLGENTCGRDSCVQLTIGPSGEAEGGSTYTMEPDGAGHWVMPDVLWTFSGPATAEVRAETAVSADNATLAFTIG